LIRIKRWKIKIKKKEERILDQKWKGTWLSWMMGNVDSSEERESRAQSVMKVVQSQVGVSVTG
jgi:hypothetical protein